MSAGHGPASASLRRRRARAPGAPPSPLGSSESVGAATSTQAAKAVALVTRRRVDARGIRGLPAAGLARAPHPGPMFPEPTTTPAFDDRPRASFKSEPEDFIVDELEAYAPSGAGEHLYVRLEKRLWTTPLAAAAVARAVGVDPRLASWAGLKDRVGLTTQTISLPWPVSPPLRGGARLLVGARPAHPRRCAAWQQAQARTPRRQPLPRPPAWPGRRVGGADPSAPRAGRPRGHAQRLRRPALRPRWRQPRARPRLARRPRARPTRQAPGAPVLLGAAVAAVQRLAPAPCA
jgi:hypothetical protein